MKLVLLTFGERLENHYQAAFSILTFLKDPLIHKVLIATDCPEFYRIFQEKVEVIHITKNTLVEWQGDVQFFWRIKIKALELVQQSYPDEHLLYVDSDTFLVKLLAEIHSELEQNHSVMHQFNVIYPLESITP